MITLIFGTEIFQLYLIN